jgi:large subunit ribosomal protein L13
MSKTPYFTKDNVERKWVVVDATDQVLGRFSSLVAGLLIGKNTPNFTPGQDCGVFVVVKNAAKIRVTGNKLKDKLYHHHSGYPGGLKTRTLEERLARHAEEVIRDAVKGMLPRNKLGNRLITKLKIYNGEDHPHQAQLPEDFSFDN